MTTAILAIVLSVALFFAGRRGMPTVADVQKQLRERDERIHREILAMLEENEK